MSEFDLNEILDIVQRRFVVGFIREMAKLDYTREQIAWKATEAAFRAISDQVIHFPELEQAVQRALKENLDEVFEEEDDE